MNYIGVDLHKKTIVICVVGQDFKVITRRCFACGEMDRIREWFATQRPFQVAVEATAAYEWFLRLIESDADRVVLAHPGKLRVIAESTRKTDKIDARVLAEFLAHDMLPQSYRPTPRERDHRRFVRHRAKIQGEITSLKTRIRNVLADYNLDRCDLFTRRGRAYLDELDISEADRFVIEDMWQTMEFHKQRLNACYKQMRTFAENDSPANQRAREVLATIPGVGLITIEVFLAEVADVRRFSSQKKLAAATGLTPGYRESAGKRRGLGITHTGPPLLRWVLVQAAWQLVRRDPRWRRIFEGLSKRRGSRKAIVAVARRLAGMMMSMVTEDRPYKSAA